MSNFLQLAFISAANVCISELIASSTPIPNSPSVKLNETIGSSFGDSNETNVIQICVCFYFSAPICSAKTSLSYSRSVYTINFINRFKHQISFRKMF